MYEKDFIDKELEYMVTFFAVFIIVVSTLMIGWVVS